MTPPAFAAAFGEELARSRGDVAAVLFYGSALRTGDRDGVLDYYVLTMDAPRRLASRLLWPDVSYREWDDGAGVLRAKVATMSLGQFVRAAAGEDLDTTIWARFVQPAVVVWTRDEAARAAVARAVEDAGATASRYAAALGPKAGAARDFWAALFRQTYKAEFRIEPAGREQAILAVDPAHYEQALRQGWRRAGVAFEETGEGRLRPDLSTADRAQLVRAWRLRRRLGPLRGLLRIAKAAFTFEGAARYAAWKIERHTGVVVPLTPWRERHPLLAAPAALWRLWRARRVKV